ncbi:RICIN domain-containing protein [Nonomuraea sp. NPDC050547]|uniref:RICIN domain-containing protein n=1 Tax=Nonomuraea sp. NPDC050547 TaxID=3364368 RepID=UPI0037940ACD
MNRSLRTLLGAVAALVFIGTLLTTPAHGQAVASTQFAASASAMTPYWPAPGLYKIRNVKSGKCLNIPNGSTAEGASVTQFTCGDWNDHKWSLEPIEGDFYRIRNLNSGRCLAIPGGTHTPNTQAIQWGCGPWDDHKWRFEIYPSGNVQIINKHAGQCLAVRNGDIADGAPVIQFPCGSWLDHFWRLERL